MTKLIFFHQRRKDGGIRTGIEINDDLVLEQFIPGTSELDPVLLWYIDVRLEFKKSISPEANSVRTAVSAIANPIREALRASANEFQAGIDRGIWPARRKISGLPSGISGEVVCSTTRALRLEDLSAAFAALGRDFSKIVDRLQPVTEPAY
jgi:hypothetical protein